MTLAATVAASVLVSTPGLTVTGPAGTGPAVTKAGVSTASVAYCQTPVDRTNSGAGQATVNRFDIGRHESTQPRFDRVVIGLSEPVANYQVRYVPQIIQDGSGFPVPLKGDADLEVRIDSAVAHDQNGNSSIPVRNYEPANWGSLRQATLVSDFEGIVIVGLGLRTQVDFQVFTLTGPDRLVIDVARPGEHPWNCQSGAVKVFFMDEPRFVANTPPFYTPVWRRVQVPAVAGGALHSLFHGPLVTEYERGLRFVNSDAFGFTRLSISDRIARVHLTGGCDAHGSTESIAGEIIPTLKRFPNVTYVKIYDPNGRTADPTGPRDSIPDCLNP